MEKNKMPLLLRLSQYKLLAVIVVIIIAGIVIMSLLFKTRNDKVGIVRNGNVDITPVQIERIRQIGQWEFLSLSDEELVDTVRRGFFSDDELARIYYGTLRLGIDLNKVGKDWITMDHDTVAVTLPPIQLLDNQFLDEARTRSLYEDGKWSAQDKAQMTQRAIVQMRRRCLTKENIQKAEANAKEQFSNLLKSLGFKYSRITISNH